MDIAVIEELLKISNEEIKLLNDLNEKTLTEEDELNDELILVRKQERFLKRDIKKCRVAEIFYMIVGSSRHTIDDESITLKEGELLLVNKYAHHKVDRLLNEDVAIRIVFDEHFRDVNLLENDYLINFLLNTLLLEKSKMSFIRFDISNLKSVRNIIENMTYIALKKENVSSKTNIFYLNLMFEHIKNECSKLKYSSNAKDVRTTIMVMKYIEENLRDGELNDIADKLLVNQYTLSRMIKRMTGCTFKELLQIKKLDTALELLNNTDMPITKIADTIGYENTSYFHKIFKEKYGVSPKKYRD